MIPTRLNLLPPKKRIRLTHMRYFQFLKNNLEFLLLILCIAGIVLLGAQTILDTHFSNLVVHLTNIAEQQNEKTRDITNINKALKDIESVQKIYTHWSPLLVEFGNQIPDTIILSSMSIDRGQKTLSLSGTRHTREELLELKKALEAMPYIDTVEIPLSQLAEKNLAAFSLTVPITIK